jgi:hypothetical protein
MLIVMQRCNVVVGHSPPLTVIGKIDDIEAEKTSRFYIEEFIPLTSTTEKTQEMTTPKEKEFFIGSQYGDDKNNFLLRKQKPGEELPAQSYTEMKEKKQKEEREFKKANKKRKNISVSEDSAKISKHHNQKDQQQSQISTQKEGKQQEQQYVFTEKSVSSSQIPHGNIAFDRVFSEKK